MDLQEYKALLADLGVDSKPPSATSLGFREVSEGQIKTFLAYLNEQTTAGRLRTKVLPRCDVRNFAKFVILAAHPGIEGHFVQDKKRRGQKVQAALRKRFRESKRLGGDVQILARAKRAFDIRRLGLTSCSFLLIVREYVQFRAGVKLRPQDWGALLSAVYAATEKPRMVDGDLVQRNLRNLAGKHPDRIPSGQQAAEIIEIRPRTHFSQF